MSQQVPVSFVNQYSQNIYLLSQQKTSKFAPMVRQEMQKGERAFYEQIGPVGAVPWGERHGDTPLMETPHSRRAVTMTPYIFAALVDKPDLRRMLIDPTSSYVVNAVQAFNRTKDDIIIKAALGTAYTGKEGTTQVALPASQKIAVGAAGLTIDKLIEIRQKFRDNDVDEEIPLCIAVSPSAISDLLKTTQVTNADYNTVKALVQGNVDTFMGFKFFTSTRLPWVSGTRSCFAWAVDGLLVSMGEDIKARVDERADKKYSTQVYVEMDMGATRMEEVKVVQVDIQETATPPTPAP